MLCPDDCFSVLFSFKKKLRRRQRKQNNMENQENSGDKNIEPNTDSCGDTARDQEAVDNNDVRIVRVLSASASDTITNPFHEWMKRARKYQQSHYNSLGDRVWDLIENDDMLEKKIGFALYGVPTIVKNNDNKYTLSYNDEQDKHIRNVKNHLISLWSDIKSKSDQHNDNESLSLYLACIFVYLRLKDDDNKEGIDILFRIPKTLNINLDEYLFIDANCRTYINWNDYLQKNKLPKCDMCYPLNGIYSTRDSIVKIGFKESPRCNLSKSILAGLDITSAVLTLGATGVSVAALAVPVTAPFIWGATATILASGAYDITRHVNKLIDIKKHYESLSLKNPESRGAWIGLAATAVGVASVGGAAISRGIMASEQIVSRTGAITLRIINMSSIAINGVGVLNSLITIVMKYLNGTLEKDDLIQFTSACYFFLNAIVSLNIVNRLIKDIASSDINNLFHTTKNSVFNFTKSAIEFSDSNTYNLLRTLVLGSRSQLMPDINLNDVELIIHQILSLISQLSSNTISLAKFVIELSDILENIWRKFRHVIIRSIEELCKIFTIKDWRSYVIRSNYKPFAQSSPDIARQFCMAIHKTIDYCNLDESNTEYINDILNLINEFNSNFPNENSIDFLNKTKFICESIIKEFDTVKQAYELNLDIVNSNLKTNNESYDDILHFNQSYGIEGDKNVYFFKKTLNKLQWDNISQDMYNSYCDLSNNCMSSLNEMPCMETSISNHYVFSGPPGCKSLTEQQYFQKLNDITNYHLSKDNSVILSKKNVVLIRPNDDNHDIKAVVFYSTYEKGCVMGILTVLKNINDNYE